MLQISENTRQELIRLVPSALVNEISCFAFYDKHPRDEKNIDVVICTSIGELKEYYKREIIDFAFIEILATDVKLYRNSKSELFYVVYGEETVLILSTTSGLRERKRIINVERYEVNDFLCRGNAYLKIVRKDDAASMILDEDFNENVSTLLKQPVEESLPIFTRVNRKLSQAKYGYQCNQKAYKELLRLRQQITFATCQKATSQSAVLGDASLDTGALEIKIHKPWVRLCNKKIVLILEVVNKSNRPVENIHIMLQTDKKLSLVYTSKVYKQYLLPPYWTEVSSTVQGDSKMALIAVIDLKELKYDIISKVVLEGVVCYESQGNETLLLFDKVQLSTMVAYQEQFNVLSRTDIGELDKLYTILALIATTDKLDLCIRHLRNDEDAELELFSVLCQYLPLDMVANENKIALFRRSPYDIMCGVMLVQQECCTTADRWTVTIHTRCPAQILAFIQYIHDAIPYNLIVTAADQYITAIFNELSKHNEEPSLTPKKYNHVAYGTTILHVASIILTHFDKCMVKMQESKNPMVQRKIGEEIDLSAAGNIEYQDFRKSMLEETAKGIKAYSISYPDHIATD